LVHQGFIAPSSAVSHPEASVIAGPSPPKRTVLQDPSTRTVEEEERLIREVCEDVFGAAPHTTKTWQTEEQGPSGKVSMPYLSWVFGGTIEKGYVLEEEWDMIKVTLQDEVLRRIEAGQIIPDLAFQWFGWRSGGGLIACQDEETQKWYAEMISHIKVNDRTFRLWRRGEQGSLRRFQFTFSDPTLLARSTDDILKIVKACNRSLHGRFVFVGRRRINGGRRDVVTLMVDDAYAESARLLRWKFNLITDKGQCRYSDFEGLMKRNEGIAALSSSMGAVNVGDKPEAIMDVDQEEGVDITDQVPKGPDPTTSPK
jgi:hypothetical protein